VKFDDLRQLDDNLLIETDLCIVGSGPAGLSIAKEFAGTNVQVWVIESGGMAEEPDTQTLYDIESVGAPRVMDQGIIRYRIYGGTSHIWTGRCAPFDDIDYQQRPWVPFSGWPIARNEVDQFLDRAGHNLGLGPQCYDERLWQSFKASRPTPLLDSTVLQPQFWQFSKSAGNPGEPARFGRHFMPSDAPNIHVLLHANVTHINTNETGTKAESIEVSTLEGKRACIKAETIVLCCGGVENARLLLASNRILPNGVGNQYDNVGRFLMDHAGCVMGVFDPTRSAQVQNRFGHYWLDNDAGRHVYLQGIALSPAIQEKEQLLNCAAYLETTPAEDDPWEVLRRIKASRRNPSALTKPMHQEAMSILAHPHRMSQGVYRRLVKHRPPIPKAAKLDLFCLVEQRPDPDSRIMLSDQKDALGMPISRLNWQISEQERHTVRRLGQLICQEFQRMGLPQPVLSDWLDATENWQSNFTDRAHPTGTTRMSANPKDGVVDVNGQVHGVDGLYVAGSSVFPTTGHANPTLMVVAMSLRLADWLKAHRFGCSVPSDLDLAADREAIGAA
jgi:choline dehydrogenase-like flavoprotein